MTVCYCENVPDDRVVQAIASGARLLKAIGETAGAGIGNECEIKNSNGLRCVKDIQAVIVRYVLDADAQSRGCGCCRNADA